MAKCQKKTHASTLGCGAAGTKLILIAALFVPALWAFNDFPDAVKSPRITEILKVVEVIEKPRPKELVKVYNIVKSHRSDITDSEAWRVSEVILEESLKHNLDPMLVVAVIEVESGFQYSAVSPMGARGIMQIMPDTGKFLTDIVGREDGVKRVAFKPEFLDDPILNIRLGVYYLQDLKRQFSNVNLALLAYNYGPGEIQSRLENKVDISHEYAVSVLNAYKRNANRKAPTF